MIALRICRATRSAAFGARIGRDPLRERTGVATDPLGKLVSSVFVAILPVNLRCRKAGAACQDER